MGMNVGKSAYRVMCNAVAHTIEPFERRHILLPNAKLTHGSLESAGGSTTGQGEGAEAAEAVSVTECR